MSKLKVGMIGGGGPDSFFGMVHNRAIALDASRELVAGALRSSPEAAMRAADDYGIQGYPTYQALLAAVQSGEQALDYVTIVTPNFAHYEPAKAFLQAGIPVLCEKADYHDSSRSRRLGTDRRARVCALCAGPYLYGPSDDDAGQGNDPKRRDRPSPARWIPGTIRVGWPRHWNRPASSRRLGAPIPSARAFSNCGGDIGTHAFVAATWVTGLAVGRVSARLNTFVEGRVLDDDFNVIGELENGGTALITATQIAVGYRNDNGFRVFGTEGSIEWHQERAECLLVRHGDGRDITYWIGAEFGLPESVASYLRVPSGHHEDFFPALANLHTTIERHIRTRRGEQDVPAAFPHPGVEEGVAGMKFVAAAVESSKNSGAWTQV